LAQADVAIVTGGAGGIGKAIVRRLLNRGMAVYIIDADEGALGSVLSDLGGGSVRLDGCRANVIEEREVTAAIDRAVTRFGNPYALVHVAGGAGPKRAREIEGFELPEWQHVIVLNLTSAFLAARAVVPMMRKQRRGRIVVFSSVISKGEKGPLTTVTGRLPYATAKAALLGFTSQLAKDLIEYGITVNALMPGLILGEQGTRIRDKFDNLEPEQKQLLLGGYPGGRPGTGEEIAAAIDYLLSEAAGFTSGITLPVDGAYL